MSQLSQQEKSAWADHVSAQQSSGLSQKAYCEQHALKHHQFGYWKRKTEGGAMEKSNPQRQPKKPGFVPVKVVTPPSAHGLSIVLPNGLTFSGISEHNHLLAQLLIGVLK